MRYVEWVEISDAIVRIDEPIIILTPPPADILDRGNALALLKDELVSQLVADC